MLYSNILLFCSEEPINNMESPVSDEEVPIHVQARRYFQSLLDRNITTLSAETNILTTLDPGRKG